MPTLTERVDLSIAALKAEKDRIRVSADTDMAAVEAKLAVLRSAKQALTPALEAAYSALVLAGLVKEL
jgi:hypothetical protein